ncbi:DUF3592 domain-containing protein [Corallococcus exiguus]|uniref:DUF3592 domain-containing protein n=1 Tax=Corallococcus TaxID=83461 RepID=UPI000EA0663D|nr:MULTISPECIES: DUF3592 domain-containing protein [Corallococcus]NNC22058.1 DUF3592 domain-containing protein [Corallococcus exiguus]NRD58311.1 DUF3592 domain-containing protein [Corallococcus exiguus]NRD65486.1 DUF3592 domain-containing protein [Corallococcus exiguus]RKH17170.1 DUF3592 domain-containing protein [Corallococcus sp. CA041A]RKH99049.1 DUF3592 domain-containing protein [Corallococcus sp. AB030]
MGLRANLKALVMSGTAFSLMFGYFAWSLHGTEQALLARPTVPGRMLAISVELGVGKSRDYWSVKPRYAYEIKGRSYVGEDLSNSPPREYRLWNPQPSPELTQYLARYPVGATVPVHYDPRIPGRSVLEVNTGAALGFTLASAVAGLGAVLLFLWSRRAGSHAR